MAEILSTLAFLALGVAIGWWIKRRFFAPVYAESEYARASREWTKHAEEYAEAQKASLVWTAPPAQFDEPSAVASPAPHVVKRPF